MHPKQAAALRHELAQAAEVNVAIMAKRAWLLVEHAEQEHEQLKALARAVVAGWEVATGWERPGRLDLAMQALREALK